MLQSLTPEHHNHTFLTVSRLLSWQGFDVPWQEAEAVAKKKDKAFDYVRKHLLP